MIPHARAVQTLARLLALFRGPNFTHSLSLLSLSGKSSFSSACIHKSLTKPGLWNYLSEPPINGYPRSVSSYALWTITLLAGAAGYQQVCTPDWPFSWKRGMIHAYVSRGSFHYKGKRPIWTPTNNRSNRWPIGNKKPLRASVKSTAGDCPPHAM